MLAHSLVTEQINGPYDSHDLTINEELYQNEQLLGGKANYVHMNRKFIL